MIQVNNFIKTLFDEPCEKELHETLDKFWSGYTKFNYKKYPFDSNVFIWGIKYICYGYINLWHQKYSLPSTKVLRF